MKTLLVLIFAISLTVTSVKAQNTGSGYKTAIGLKVYPTGFTIKHFTSGKTALEGLAYFRNYGARIVGLYEIHNDIPNAGGLQWYYGAGAHIGFYNSKNGDGTALGVDGVLGLDYKIPSAPINFSLDWQPAIEFGSFKNNGFTGNFGGIAIRYTLN